MKGRLARFLLPAFEIPLRANSHRERERHLGTRQTWNRAKIRIQQSFLGWIPGTRQSAIYQLFSLSLVTLSQKSL